MFPTTLIIETPSTNTLSPNIALSEFPFMESTQPTQYKTIYPANFTVVACSTLPHQKITMYPTVYSLTIKYFYICEQTGHTADSCKKQGLPFLLPHLRQQMHQYNLKNGFTPNLPQTGPQFRPPQHRPPPATSTTPTPIPNQKPCRCESTPPLH